MVAAAADRGVAGAVAAGAGATNKPLAAMGSNPHSRKRLFERTQEPTGVLMPLRMRVHDREPIGAALRRFKKLLERSGLLKALRERKDYEKTCELRRPGKLPQLNKNPQGAVPNPPPPPGRPPPAGGDAPLARPPAGPPPRG